MMTLPLHALQQQARSIARGAPAWPHLPAIARGRLVGNTLAALRSGDPQALNRVLSLKNEPDLQQLAAAKGLLRRFDAGESLPSVPDRTTLLAAVKYQQSQVLAQHRQTYLRGLENRDIFQLLINSAHVSQRQMRMQIGSQDRFTGITTRQTLKNDNLGELEMLFTSPWREGLRNAYKRPALNYILFSHGRGQNLPMWQTTSGHPVLPVLERVMPSWREALTWCCFSNMVAFTTHPRTWTHVVNYGQRGPMVLAPKDIITPITRSLKKPVSL